MRIEIFEKTLKFTYKNFNGKLIFYPFSLPSSWTFVILYTFGTSKIWRVGGPLDPGLGGRVPSSLGGRGAVYIPTSEPAQVIKTQEQS